MNFFKVFSPLVAKVVYSNCEIETRRCSKWRRAVRKNFTAPPGPGSCLLNCRVEKHPLPTLRTRNAIVDPRAGASSPLSEFSGR